MTTRSRKICPPAEGELERAWKQINFKDYGAAEPRRDLPCLGTPAPRESDFRSKTIYWLKTGII